MHQNIDQNELNKFDQLAAQWWDPSAALKTLHDINPLRVKYINEKTSLAEKNILDIGCGGGILSESLAKLGGKVTGIDMNKSLIEVAKLHQLETGTDVEYVSTSAESFAAIKPATFDVICCLEMLEHVPDPYSIIKAISILAKPDAKIFLSTINRNPKAYLFAILGAEYFLKLLPKNTHEYAKFIRPSELCHWLRSCQLEPLELMGIHYNPFNYNFKLTKDISVNYLVYASK